MCTATVDRLRRMPVRAELSFVPLQKLAAGEIAPWPGIEDVPVSALSAQLHVTDEAGGRFSGADGVFRLLECVPSLAWLAAVGRMPGFRAVARAAYRLVARYRYRLFGRTSCSDGVCSLPRRTKEIEGGGHDHSKHPQ